MNNNQQIPLQLYGVCIQTVLKALQDHDTYPVYRDAADALDALSLEDNVKAGLKTSLNASLSHLSTPIRKAIADLTAIQNDLNKRIT